MNATLLWYDYETFGIDPQRDKPAQFAAVRTDLAFNVVNEPVCFFCKIPEDYLPQPDACLITGITPQQVAKEGVCEAEFAKRIHAQFIMPDTCVLGYNNLRFDDEVTRNLFYRNFYDPYAREWQNGNSRWDLIDVVRAARALRPEGVHWPLNEEGRPSFRLEDLTRANGIDHSGAHDALVDVYATIALAKLIKTAQPKLFDFLWRHRGKAQALDLLAVGRLTPVVHVSGMYSALRHCLAIVLPLCKHPTNTNEVIVYDLSVDPEPLLALSVEEIQYRLFTSTADLPEGVPRIPLKTVHINRCPVLAPLSVIREQDAQRLDIDLALCQSNRDRIESAMGLVEKLMAVYRKPDADIVAAASASPSEGDPDTAIYSGGFFAEADKQLILKINRMPPAQLATAYFAFKDQRLPQLLFRYRARNFPETLTTDEMHQWQIFCLDRLAGVSKEKSSACSVFADYCAQLQALRASGHINMALINSLEGYAIEKMQRLGYAFN